VVDGEGTARRAGWATGAEGASGRRTNAADSTTGTEEPATAESGTAGPAATTAPSPLWITSIAASADRIAAMCSGVVPQQPPTIRAPLATACATIPPKY